MSREIKYPRLYLDTPGLTGVRTYTKEGNYGPTGQLAFREDGVVVFIPDPATDEEVKKILHPQQTTRRKKS